MSTAYRVGVREVHLRYYRVRAENEGAAKEAVELHRERAEDLEHSEFSHELPPETWSVERSADSL